jgi:hypothetical protein
MSTHSPVVLDVAGTALDAADRRRLKHPLVGGVVLFARNWESRAQLTALTSQIKAVRPTCWSASTTRAAACSVSAPTGSPTCRPCAPWARCG